MTKIINLDSVHLVGFDARLGLVTGAKSICSCSNNILNYVWITFWRIIFMIWDFGFLLIGIDPTSSFKLGF